MSGLSWYVVALIFYALGSLFPYTRVLSMFKPKVVVAA